MDSTDIKGISKTADSGLAARNREKENARSNAGVRPDVAAPRQATRARAKPASTAASTDRDKGPLESLGEAVSAPIKSTTEEEDITGASAQPGAVESKASGARSRDDRIREAAYRRFEARGGAPGEHDRDWFDAEAEIDRDTG